MENKKIEIIWDSAVEEVIVQVVICRRADWMLERAGRACDNEVVDARVAGAVVPRKFPGPGMWRIFCETWVDVSFMFEFTGTGSNFENGSRMNRSSSLLDL